MTDARRKQCLDQIGVDAEGREKSAPLPSRSNLVLPPSGYCERMTLPLFDAEPDPAPRAVTLIRLSGEIARSLGAIGRITVEGEVYRPVTGRTGSIFFTLRDRVAQMDVRVPAAAARRSRVVAGERVSVVANLQWSNERGQVQLVAEEVLPVGTGAIAAMIAATRTRLAADGLLDRPRRPIPVLPAVVGVVCGTEAAVRKDIESVVTARCAGYPVHFQETTVSGPAASLAIVEALEAVAAEPGVEVIILARGGGDAPSLLPWSTEEVCRAVAVCPVPVVSAIGHEGDKPLCDEVADLRCGTPSLAATAVLPDMAALGRAVDDALATCLSRLVRVLELSERRLAGLDTRGAAAAGVGAGENPACRSPGLACRCGCTPAAPGGRRRDLVGRRRLAPPLLGAPGPGVGAPRRRSAPSAGVVAAADAGAGLRGGDPGWGGAAIRILGRRRCKGEGPAS